MGKTKIEWATDSWNPIRARNRSTGKVGWHCEHATPGCEHCYSESLNKRLGTGLPFKPGHRADVEIFLDEEMLLAPARWKKPRMIFVCSMTDLFADFVSDEAIDRVFAVMALAPQHTFQVLTKRAARMREYLTKLDAEPVADTVRRIVAAWPGRAPIPEEIVFPLPNVWLGVSCERQAEADERVPDLLATPAAVRFVSAEPLLGPVDFEAIRDPNHFPGCLRKDVLRGHEHHEDDDDQWTIGKRLDWIIIGGESGPRARPMQVAWARSIVDQCRTAGVYCFVKQLGADPVWEDGAFLNLRDRKGGDMAEWPADLRVREMPPSPSPRNTKTASNP